MKCLCARAGWAELFRLQARYGKKPQRCCMTGCFPALSGLKTLVSQPVGNGCAFWREFHLPEMEAEGDPPAAQRGAIITAVDVPFRR